jgi:cytochrome oxidase Cu insertion factor (SCO1/SenC/PrrC family)
MACATMLAAVVFCGCQKKTETPQPVPSGIVPATPKLTSYDLTDQLNRPFNSKSLEGEVHLVSFFFAQCPSVCWRMNEQLAKWRKEHPDAPVKLVSITCDPENDTPPVMAKYGERFGAKPDNWKFLTGDMNYITKLAQDIYMLGVQKHTHSSRVVVVDRQGKVRGSFEVTEPAEYKRFEKTVDEVVAEG